ncbi:ribose-phosphate diphosphokinase [Solimonas soli]|uniref:ribose-phosphate diphosphokinase n=1 Tax=Solimonas soli TaxID=413479 RepID=UPI0004843847|nr:ribose-phosphate diphosphokinase [Solimonas soli]
MSDAPIVYALPGNGPLAQVVAAHCDGERGDLWIHRFPDGETGLRALTAPRGRDTVIVCGLDDADVRMATLHFTAATLREHGARRIVLVAPYLAYMRQDAVFLPGSGALARHYAAWLGSLFDALVTVDPHLHRIHALRDIFAKPAEAVSAAPAIADWLAGAGPHAPLLVGPDGESEQWVAAIAARLGCPHVCFRKERRGDDDVLLQASGLAAHRGRHAVVVDDIASTAETLRGAVQALSAAGFARPLCIVVHAIFAGHAYARLRAAGAGDVISCNTIAHASNRIDIRGAVAAATAAVLCGDAAAPRALAGLTREA